MASGSSGTYSPSQSVEKRNQQKRKKYQEIDWARSDGRNFHQCRPAFLRTGATNAASGSAYAEFGLTKVIVSVFGPRESKKAMMYSNVGRLNCHVSYTTFSTSIRGGQGSENKEYSSMLHKALEDAIILDTFPKTTVDIFALVLESGGGDLPVIISCASLALADAGIMMYDLVSAVSMINAFIHCFACAQKITTLHELEVSLCQYEGVKRFEELGLGPFLRHPLVKHYFGVSEDTTESIFGKNMVIDPTYEEESYQDGSLMIAYMPNRNEVTQFTLTGEWSTAKINEAMELCIDACSKLVNILRSCLKENVLELAA